MDTKRPTHASYQELLLLSIDELPAQRAEEVREHLIECDACLAQMRELLRLPETPPLPEMAIGEEEQAAAWQRLSATIAAQENETDVDEGKAALPLRVLRSRLVEDSALTSRPPKRFFETFPALLTAALLAAAIGLGLGRWVVPVRPSNSGATTQISSSANLRGEPPKPVKAVCPTGDGSFVWVVTPMYKSAQAPDKVWGKVIDSNTRVIEHLELPVSSKWESTFIFQRSELPNGTYLVQISLNRDGLDAHEFAVAVECP